MMLPEHKVDQTIFGDGKGNCWPACIATITGLPLEGMPNFCAEYPREEWFMRCVEWLRERGFAMWNCPTKGDTLNWVDNLVPNIPWIATGRNTRGMMHCCVYIGSKLWHDPNPQMRAALSDGLVEVEDATFFLKRQYR